MEAVYHVYVCLFVLLHRSVEVFRQDVSVDIIYDSSMSLFSCSSFIRFTGLLLEAFRMSSILIMGYSMPGALSKLSGIMEKPASSSASWDILFLNASIAALNSSLDVGILLTLH